MIHIFRRKPEFTITHVVSRYDNKKTKVECEKEYIFPNLYEASVFLHHLYKLDIGLIACFTGEDEFHYTSTTFHYGIKYCIEYDDMKVYAEINHVNRSGMKLPLYIAKDIMTVFKIRR